MLLFPVAASETVEQDRKYFLINKRSAVVWSTLTVGECQRFISGIKWIERKAVFGMMRSVIKEFMKKPLPGIHMDRNLCKLPGCRIFQYDVYVPVQAFEQQILKVQRNLQAHSGFSISNEICPEIKGSGIFVQFILIGENSFYIFKRTGCKICADIQVSMAESDGAQRAGRSRGGKCLIGHKSSEKIFSILYHKKIGINS